MSFATVHLIDSFTGKVVCKSSIVVYEDRRLYVAPSVEPLVTSRVMHLEPSRETPPPSFEVHREFSSLLLSFGKAVHDFFLSEDDVEELSSKGSFFFLTEGLGIRVTEAKPELLQTTDEETGEVSTLAVFHTQEGILPHRMLSNKVVDTERMSRLLLGRFPNVDPADLDSTELVPNDEFANGLYQVFFRNVRVIPLH